MQNYGSNTQSGQPEQQVQRLPLLILDENYDLLVPEKKCSDIYEELIEENISLQRGLSQLSKDEKSIPQPFNTSFGNFDLNIGDSSKTETVLSNHIGLKCKCTKSKCQKNYCQCFKNGQVCSDACGCFDCVNVEETLYILHSKSGGKGGCKCKKSHCMKNYCQCHNQGRKCSPECVCLECYNTGDDSSTQTVQILGKKGHKKIKMQAICENFIVQNNKTNIKDQIDNILEEKSN